MATAGGSHRSQLSHWRFERSFRRSTKTLRHLDLDQFRQSAALIDETILRAVPRQESAARRAGCTARHCHLLHRIHSYCSGLPRGGNVQGDENIPTLRVCRIRAVIERRVVIGLAREDYAQSLGFQRNAQQPSKAERNVAFRDARRSSRALVGSAMRRIHNHKRQSFMRSGSRLNARLCLDRK